MNTVPTMKLVALFSRLALTGLAAFILGVALDTQPLALFAAAIGTLVLLVVAGDYAPRASLRPFRPTDIVPFAPTPAPIETPEKLAA
jgi:hypothetical protein